MLRRASSELCHVAYICRNDEGLQFFALQSGIAERCIKAIQDFAYSGFGDRGGKHDDIFWDNESYTIKHYLKMFAEFAIRMACLFIYF